MSFENKVVKCIFLRVFNFSQLGIAKSSHYIMILIRRHFAGFVRLGISSRNEPLKIRLRALCVKVAIFYLFELPICFLLSLPYFCR